MPLPADPSPALKDYAHPERLVTADWLSAHLGTPGLAIVESDEDVLLYDIGHIPGAVKIDWHTDLNDPVVRDYITGEQFADLMNRKGISRDDTVVIYGDKSNWWAAYALWVFTLFGHQDVRLLDGGRDLWISDGRDTTLDVPVEDHHRLSRRRARRRRRSAPSRTTCWRRSATSTLIDVRSPQEYTGERTHMPDYPEEGALRGGHIPTAVSVPWAKAADDSGRFRSRAELETIYDFVRDDDDGDRLLPDRRALQPHLVRADPPARVSRMCATTTAPGRSGATPCGCRSSKRRGTGRRRRVRCAMSMPAPLAEVVSDFAEVEGQDKLQLLLEFADELPALPADLEEAAMEPVPECQSPLFLHVDADDPATVRLYFSAPARGAHHPRVRLDPGHRTRRPVRRRHPGRARRLLHRAGSGGADQPAAAARDVGDAGPDQAASAGQRDGRLPAGRGHRLARELEAATHKLPPIHS